MPWYERLATVFLIAAGVIAAAAFAISLARVHIVITPRVEHLAQDFELTLVGSGSVSDHQVQGRLVRVDGTAEAPIVPTQAVVSASGAPRITVTLVNTQAVAQPLIAKTRLLSPEGVQYRMVHAAVVPANGHRDGVEVVYDTAFHQPPSADMSTEIARKYTIPGLSAWLQTRVWATSAGSMQPSKEGIAELPHVSMGEAEVRRVASADADARVVALTKDGEEAITLDSNLVVTPTATTIRAVATKTALIVDRGAVTARARDVLAQSVTAGGRELVRVSEGSPTVHVVSQDPVTGRATVAVHVEGDVILRRGAQTFEPRRIAGFTAGGVQTYIRSIPGVQNVEVSLWPFWVQRVPSNLRSVDVEVRAP